MTKRRQKLLQLKVKLKQLFFWCWKIISNFGWDGLILLLILFFSTWLMTSTLGYKDQEQQIVLKSRLWSDFGAHVPLVRSFSMGENFPPEYPQFSGMKIRYHYLFYLIAGGLEAAGLNLAQAINLPSIIGFALMLGMIYQIAKLISGKRSVGILALILFLFNSSLTFFDFFRSCTSVFNCYYRLANMQEFVNFGPWNGDVISAFWNWNIYTNQRHLGLSFGLMLVMIWPLLAASYKKRYKLNLKAWIWLIWLGLVLMPFFNQAGYVMSVIFIILWLAMHPRLITKMGSLYFLGLLYSVPSFVYFFGFNTLGLEIGFLAKNKTLLAIGSYWWHNLGLYWLILPLLLLKSKKDDRKLLVIAAVYFVLVNTFRLSADMINNHKLINLAVILLVMVTAKVLVEFWQESHWKKPLVLLIVIGLTLSGVIDAFPIINDYRGGKADYQQTKLGRWIAANTSPDSVFLTSYNLYHPANLTGRSTFLDYGYFAWSLGYPDRERRKVLPEIYASDVDRENWCRLVSSLGIDYLSIVPRDEVQGILLRDTWLVKTQDPVFSDSMHRVYSVKKICSSY